MTDWIDITSLSALADGEREIAELEDGRFVVVIRIGDDVFAVEDQCSHEALPLADGEIEDHEIVCPFHGARFCLKTGEATGPPAYEPVTTFEVDIADGIVRIRDKPA